MAAWSATACTVGALYEHGQVGWAAWPVDWRTGGMVSAGSWWEWHRGVARQVALGRRGVRRRGHGGWRNRDDVGLLGGGTPTASASHWVATARVTRIFQAWRWAVATATKRRRPAVEVWGAGEGWELVELAGSLGAKPRECEWPKARRQRWDGADVARRGRHRNRRAVRRAADVVAAAASCPGSCLRRSGGHW